MWGIDGFTYVSFEEVDLSARHTLIESDVLHHLPYLGYLVHEFGFASCFGDEYLRHARLDEVVATILSSSLKMPPEERIEC